MTLTINGIYNMTMTINDICNMTLTINKNIPELPSKKIDF